MHETVAILTGDLGRILNFRRSYLYTLVCFCPLVVLRILELEGRQRKGLIPAPCFEGLKFSEEPLLFLRLVLFELLLKLLSLLHSHLFQCGDCLEGLVDVILSETSLPEPTWVILDSKQAFVMGLGYF